MSNQEKNNPKSMEININDLESLINLSKKVNQDSQFAKKFANRLKKKV